MLTPDVGVAAVFTRRHFLAGCIALLGLPLFSAPRWAFAADARRQLIAGVGKSVCAVDLQSRQVAQVGVDFKPHGYAQNPGAPAQIWAFEKWGRGAAVIDFADGAVTKAFTSPENTQYFGHGLFSRDGKTCFAVREDLTTGLGHCIGFDPVTYQERFDIQATPGGLHECHLLEDDSFLVASNGAPVFFKDGILLDTPMVERSSLVHVDPVAGKVIDKKFIADDDQIIGHFAMSRTGAIIALSSQRRSAQVRHGAIYFGHVAQPTLRRVELPEPLAAKLVGEMLSIAIDETRNLALVTNPGGSSVLFIDSRNGTFLGALDNKIYGVVFDAALEGFIGSGQGLVLIKSQQEKVLPQPVQDKAGAAFVAAFDGAHSILADNWG